MVGYQLDDEPNLYIGNGWKSPFPSIIKWLAFGVPGIYDSNMFQQTKKAASNRYAQTFLAKKNLMVCKFLYKIPAVRKHSKTLAQNALLSHPHCLHKLPSPLPPPTLRRSAGAEAGRAGATGANCTESIGRSVGLAGWRTKQVGSHPRVVPTLKLTFSHLNMDPWNMIVSFKGLLAYFQGC